MQELRGIGFPRFGGLRLDLGLDEVGADNAIYLRDVDWDGSTGVLRTRDGFTKLKATEATGPYKGLFPHSSLRMLATKRVSTESVKLVALDREGVEKTEATFPATAGKPAFARYGVPTASYTYARAGTATAKVQRFDGSSFTEPTATVDKSAGKEMPRAYFMQAWPDARNRMVFACTGSEGGPNKAASSASHVWFSMAGSAEEFESTAYVQLSPGDGEEIQGMCLYGGQIFVFKETKFFVFYGVTLNEENTPEFNFREVSLGEGSRVKRSSMEALAESSDQICAAGPEGVYFATTDGIYVTTGGAPAKISQPLKPLEEAQPFYGPMAEFLNGSSESFRWPASGLCVIGTRLYVKRYEFMFKCELPTGEWLCDRMPAVSFCAWTGLTGGGTEATQKLPGTGADSSAVGTVAWSNPSNITTESTSTYAEATPAALATTHYLKATGFGIALPSTATVRGVVVEVNRFSEGTGIVDSAVHLVKAGTVVTTQNKASATPWAPGGDSGIYGSSEDLWGETLSYSDVNDSGFGCVVSVKRTAGGATPVRVYWVWLSVYYTVDSSGARPRLFCSQGKFAFYAQPGAEDQAGYSSPVWQSGFYDLDLEDEKTLEHFKIAGTGAVNLSVAKDFGDVGEASAITMGTSPAVAYATANKTQTASLFSHRFSGAGPWKIQRFVRYLRETRVAATKSTP